MKIPAITAGQNSNLTTNCITSIMSKIIQKYVSGIGAVVKVVDSHPCGWGSSPDKSCSFFIVFLSKSLSLCSMCSDQHVKYPMPRRFPLTSSLLLDYQYIHIKNYSIKITWYIISPGYTEMVGSW